MLVSNVDEFIRIDQLWYVHTLGRYTEMQINNACYIHVNLIGLCTSESRQNRSIDTGFPSVSSTEMAELAHGVQSQENSSPWGRRGWNGTQRWLLEFVILCFVLWGLVTWVFLVRSSSCGFILRTRVFFSVCVILQ